MKHKKIDPSAKLLKATATYLMAIAHTQCIRPTIEAIQKQQLLPLEYRNQYDSSIITDPKYAYDMHQEDFLHYLHALHAEYIKAGFTVENDSCPLLIAENLERQAKHFLIQRSLELKIGIDLDRLYSRQEWVDTYTDLLLKLLVPLIDPSLLELPNPKQNEL